MDETRTRAKLDDLADLFLTGAIDHAEPGPGSASEQLDGPAPIRIAPKPAQKDDAQGQGDHETSLDDLVDETSGQGQGRAGDDLPKLRLIGDDTDEQGQGDEQPEPTPAASSRAQDDDLDVEPARAAVEAIIMGNLPGLGGPWLTQYAQLIAQSDGPVAILHVAEDAIDVELVEPRAESLPSPTRPTATLRIPPMRGGRTGLMGLLDALVGAKSGAVQTILVRLEPTTDPRDLSRLAAIDDWTLLCGSDDASIASGRQMLQQLTHADPRLAGKHVGVMVMGSDESKAEAASSKLAQEVQDMVAQPVQYIGHLQRMQPVQVRQLGTFNDPVSLWPQLVAWFDALELPEVEEAQAVQAPAADKSAAENRRDPRQTQNGSAGTQTTADDQASTPQDAGPAKAPAKPAADLGTLGSTPAARPGPFHVPKPPPPAALRRLAQAPPKPAAADQASTRQSPPASEQDSSNASATPSAKTQTKSEQASATPKRTTHAPPATPTTKEPVSATEPVARKPAAAPRASAKPSPKPAARSAAPADPAARPRNLRPAPRLDLAELLADTPAAINDPASLDARIPHQPNAQLVVDAQGTIHVLVRHDSSADDAAADPQTAILDLIDARRWINEHLELLALTQRDREFATTQPVLHLLTDRADLAMGLVARLGDSLKLHLLQQVSLGRETGWFCTPLN